MALALCFCLAAFFAFNQNNEFPFFYHPDEPGKIRQVVTGEWNFHHPMLLVGTVRSFVGLVGMESGEQSVANLGRVASALFGAVAILFFGTLAWQQAGLAGLIIVTLLLGLHHQLFELSHYFKEDTALLAGVALAFVAISGFWSRPTTVRTVLLGLACAIAVSGKYIGAFMVLLAIPVLLTAPATLNKSRTATLLLFLAVFATGFAFINFPFLQLFGKFTASFGREFEMVVHGQSGMTRSVPHGQYWNVFHDNVNPVLAIFLVVYMLAFWKTRQERSLPEWMALLFPFVYSLALSFSPKSNDRYFLPATALFTYLAGLGVLECARWLSARFDLRAKPTLACCLLLAIGSQLPSFYRYWNAFKTDDRAALRQWVEVHLPSDAVLVIDPRCGLPSPERAEDLKRQPPLTQKVLRKKYASDFGTLDDLRSQGVSHVIVSKSDYGRFFLQSLRPHDSYRDKYDANRVFYERLFKEGRLLWQRDRGTVIYLHPGIEVYAL